MIMTSLVLVITFLVIQVHSVPYPCSTPSIVDTASLPDAPVFPTTYFPHLSSGPYITNHWSEVAKLLRPVITPPIPNPAQTDCPHHRSNLLNWHDPSTWPSGNVPQGGDVLIPPLSHVLISSCSLNSSVVYGTITIPVGSSLIFADAPISLRAKGFKVDGSLLIGSPTCRLRNSITITLHGSRSAQSLPTYEWVKGIYVTGQIDVHGSLYAPTWTRLSKTANPGDTVIYVQDVVNWQPGQKIVITTTERKDARDWHRNEVKIIKAVYLVTGNPIGALELEDPILYQHYGGSEYQAEVALLSRNILIQGDEISSEPTDLYPIVCNDTNTPMSTYPCTNTSLTGFGAHIFVTSKSAIGRFSGLEMYRVGQTNQLARYPIHFHLIGNSSGPNQTFATDCSVHRSYFRCYAIHGTNNVLLSQNTAYDAIAHCYFLEDGVEENNTIQYNFGAHVHPLGKLQEVSQNGAWWGQTTPYYYQSDDLTHVSDIAAGVFYFTNAHNTIIGNAASGGWTGFSFPNLQYPIRLHRNVSISPRRRPFVKFQGNSAHSTGFWWGSAAGVYVGGDFHEGSAPNYNFEYTFGRATGRNTCADLACTQNGFLRFEDTKVFLANRGIQDWGDREEVIRFEGHDLDLSANVFGQVWIDQMLMNCRSENTITWWHGCSAVNTRSPWGTCNIRDFSHFSGFVGFQFYDTGMRHIITNSIFRNCNASAFKQCVQCSGQVFQLLTHSDQFIPDHMQSTKNITYQNCDMSNIWEFTVSLPQDSVSGRLQNWLDLDGSAFSQTKTGRKTLLGSSRSSEWYKLNDECLSGSVNEMWVCPMNEGDAVISMMINYDISGQQAQIGRNSFCCNGGCEVGSCPVVGSVTHFGREKSTGLNLGANSRATGPLINEAGGWFVEFNSGTPSVLSFSDLQLEDSVSVIIGIPYPTGTTFNHIKAIAASWCSWSWGICDLDFTEVSSIKELRESNGGTYYWDKEILYVKLFPVVDQGNFKGLNLSQPVTLPNDLYFSRDSVKIPSSTCCGGVNGMRFEISANCGANGNYCPYVDRTIPSSVHCDSCFEKLDAGVIVAAVIVPLVVISIIALIIYLIKKKKISLDEF